ncbi:fibroblast growth factor receptor homolog 1-like isoform X2 [Leguminivora glycinivorella]|uniref:fibroblast growth factor receptor homolog 1-like isoform X2 n=1 Tax=Leguminivora glycinivorella TaxID=1035111 RepID=UPI002010B3AC|nr:fibroblast growth factor receptor homolog 1-like isoform X2 [Leguminivora glycinivorella]
MALNKMSRFVSLISFTFISHLYLVNSAKYTITLPQSVVEPLMELYYDELDFFENYTKTRNKRASSMAAPVLNYFQHKFDEEYKDIGHSAVMKCEPKGTPTPNITWYKDNVTPVKRTDRGGVLPVTYDMWSILLNDLVTEDTGNYTCRVCNPLGCAEHVHRLIITGYPKLFPSIRKGYPGNTTFVINDSVVLSCPTKKYIITDNTLTINNATKSDEGWYLCITNNSIGTDQATGYIKVADWRKPSDGGPEKKVKGLSKWFIAILSILLIISFVVVLVVLLKFKRERLLKRHAVETAREVMFEQWMKVVSIERERSNGYTPEGTLQMPKVRIEKQRISDIVGKFPDYDINNASEYMFPPDNKWEIDRFCLTLGKVLGEGEFGSVVQAKYRGTSESNIPNTVAVKMLKEGHSDADMISFVSEIEIMKMIGKHENIINLLGCCTKGGPLYAVVEFAANGCLRDYLKKYKPKADNGPSEKQTPLKHQELVQFTLQVARGMEYLASRGCIHRDLAARNVLVTGARVLKVADFGLARDVRDSDYYRKRTAGKLPVRWMAPESLCHNYYNTKSDVWSFGVLTWEIMSYGETPYAKIPVHFLYNYLRQGKRMQKPENCSENMYQVIQHSCSFNPDDRPSFSELKDKLEEMVSSIDHLI